MTYDQGAMDSVANVADLAKDNPPYSPSGYVIDSDGIVYGLVHRWTHGAILSVLYPERFKEWHQLKPESDYNKGYDEDVPVITKHTPTEDITCRVFGFQRFEAWLTLNGYHSTVRISLSTMLAEYSVSKHDGKCTDAQMEAFRKTLLYCGCKPKDTVQMDASEVTFSTCLKLMGMNKDEILTYLYGGGRDSAR